MELRVLNMWIKYNYMVNNRLHHWLSATFVLELLKKTLTLKNKKETTNIHDGQVTEVLTKQVRRRWGSYRPQGAVTLTTRCEATIAFM